jgi:hypothetical protein
MREAAYGRPPAKTGKIATASWQEESLSAKAGFFYPVEIVAQIERFSKIDSRGKRE